MTSIVYAPVSIQTSPHSVPSVPCWFGEVTLIVRHLQREARAYSHRRADTLCPSPFRAL
jgi:hypothetical protein